MSSHLFIVCWFGNWVGNKFVWGAYGQEIEGEKNFAVVAPNSAGIGRDGYGAACSFDTYKLRGGEEVWR